MFAPTVTMDSQSTRSRLPGIVGPLVIQGFSHFLGLFQVMTRQTPFEGCKRWDGNPKAPKQFIPSEFLLLKKGGGFSFLLKVIWVPKKFRLKKNRMVWKSGCFSFFLGWVKCFVNSLEAKNFRDFPIDGRQHFPILR